MNSLLKSISFLLLILSVGCGQPKQEATETNESEDPNKYLYDQVMDIHDEVMPTMDELYTLKRQLNDKIANSSDLVETKRKEVETTILLLDSASRGMMKWMNDFSPENYNEEDLKSYLESEKKRIQKVKETMQDALDKGRKAVQ